MLNNETSAIIKSSDRKLLDKTIKYTMMGNQFEKQVIILDPTDKVVRLISDTEVDFSRIWILSYSNPALLLGALSTIFRTLSKDCILIIDHVEVFCKEFLSELSKEISESEGNISVLATQLVSSDSRVLSEQAKVTKVQEEVLSINNMYTLTGSSYLSLVGDRLTAKTGFLI